MIFYICFLRPKYLQDCALIVTAASCLQDPSFFANAIAEATNVHYAAQMAPDGPSLDLSSSPQSIFSHMTSAIAARRMGLSGAPLTAGAVWRRAQCASLLPLYVSALQ